jgi:hypothetical protein
MGHISDYTTCEPNASFAFGDQIRVHAQYRHPPATMGQGGVMVDYVR